MEFRSLQRDTPIVLNLIIINTIVYVAQLAFGGMGNDNSVNDLFALHHYKSDVYQPYQLVTHMFMHGSFFHLLFNMFGLWMFGSMMEKLWGHKRFLIFYLICGLVAGVAQMGSYAYSNWNWDHNFMSPENVELYQTMLSMNATVGASGAIMGILAAYAYTFPNTQLYIFPIPFPIKTKWALTALIAFDIFGGVSNAPGDNVAHFAHVGGAIAGLIIVIFWNKTNKKTFF
jgi:membrane associated rhomboid family serine protease